MDKAGLHRRWALSLLAGVAVISAGCSTAEDEPESEFCASLSSLEDTIAEVQSLVETDAPLDTIRAQVDQVSSAYDAVVENAADVDQAVTDEAEAAFQDFQDAVAEIPGDVATSQGAAGYNEAGRAFLQDLATISEDAGCQ